MEGNFKQKFETLPQNEENILNDWDRKYLTEGSRNVILKMYEDFNKNFPEVIVLVEKSARPLFYLFYPIFEKLKQEKGTISPKFAFFSLSNRPSNKMMIFDQWEKINEDFPGEINEDKKPERPTKEEINKLTVARQSMKERADEIIEEVKKIKPNAQMAILDDIYCAGSSIKEIRKAFGDENENIKIYIIAEFPGSDSEWDTKNPGSIRVGTSLENREDGKMVKNPSKKYIDFTFNDTESIGVEKNIDQKYVKPIILNEKEEKNNLSFKKRKLRSEMKHIGEDIANNIVSLLDE